MPDRPATNACQVSATVLPTGVTAPRPVITTRFDGGGDALTGPSCPWCSVCGANASPLQPGDLGVAETERADVAADPLDQAGQHLARSDFEEGVHAALDHLADRAGPLDRPQEVFVQLAADVF